MKALRIITIAILLIFTGCNTPRGVDEAGVWKVDYFTDVFNEPTSEPYLTGEIDGVYSGVVNVIFAGKAEYTGDAKLKVISCIKRTEMTAKQGKKEIKEDIPLIAFNCTFMGTGEYANYHESYLWDLYADWNVKIESEGLEPFTGTTYFDNEDLKWLAFSGSDADKILKIFSKGKEVNIRLRCEENKDMDEYTFSLDMETVKDFLEVNKGYKYHYSEYLKKSE